MLIQREIEVCTSKKKTAKSWVIFTHFTTFVSEIAWTIGKKINLLPNNYGQIQQTVYPRFRTNLNSVKVH